MSIRKWIATVVWCINVSGLRSDDDVSGGSLCSSKTVYAYRLAQLVCFHFPGKATWMASMYKKRRTYARTYIKRTQDLGPPRAHINLDLMNSFDTEIRWNIFQMQFFALLLNLQVRLYNVLLIILYNIVHIMFAFPWRQNHMKYVMQS